MRLLFAGTPEVALPSLRALLDSPHEVVAVLTRPDARVGRGRTLRPSPVKEVAEAAGVEVLTPASLADPETRTRLAELAPDLCAVVAYGAMIPADLLELPPHGWVNLHFSLLPAWRGAAPVQHAVLAGDEVTGASTFRIEAGLDTGPVLGMMTEQVRSDDTSGALLGRLSEAGAGLLLATVDGLAADRLTAVPQAADGVSHAPKISVADAQVDLTLPALAVDRRIRACTPAPGAWTTFRGERLGLGPATVLTPADLAADQAGSLTGLAPGELHVSKREVVVGTGSAPLRLGTVRPPGKKDMPAADWARGVRITAADRLGVDR